MNADTPLQELLLSKFDGIKTRDMEVARVAWSAAVESIIAKAEEVEAIYEIDHGPDPEKGGHVMEYRNFADLLRKEKS